MFAMMNAALSKATERVKAFGWVFKFFTRILPVPQATVRGVPIRIIIPLNQYGTYLEFKNWETREPETLDWIDAFRKDSIFFDVGASFGNETLYAALKKSGPAKIVSFDVDFLAGFNLALNLQINKVQNVEQYHLAVSDKSGVVSASGYTNYASVPGRPRYDQITHNLGSVSLDEFVRRTGDHPHYVKIDVDGHEDKIIQGMRETLESAELKSILIEVCEETEEAITRTLQAAGFHKRYESDGGIGSARNLVFSRVSEVSSARNISCESHRVAS